MVPDVLEEKEEEQATDSNHKANLWASKELFNIQSVNYFMKAIHTSIKSDDAHQLRNLLSCS